LALVLLAGLSALPACDTVGSGLLDPQEVRLSELSQDPAALVGTWQLATVTPSGECYTENCTRTRSAAEAGWSERIVFRVDGMAEVFRNGVAGEAVAYRVDSETPPARLVLGARRELFGVAGDQLFLDDRYIDGSLLEFRRLVPVSHSDA